MLAKTLKLKVSPEEYVVFTDQFPEGYGTTSLPQLFPNTATIDGLKKYGSDKIDYDKFFLVDVFVSEISVPAFKEVGAKLLEYVLNNSDKAIYDKNGAVIGFSGMINKPRPEDRPDWDDWSPEDQTLIQMGR